MRKKESILDLPKKYPKLFKNEVFFFCHGPGWDNLVRELCKELLPVVEEANIKKKIEDERMPSYTIREIKERDGMLRVHMNDTTDEIEEVIFDFTKESGHICEWCGKDGSLRMIRGGCYTRCEDCLKGFEQE